MSIEDKRLDSLARNRASAELKRLHPEEWERLRASIMNNLLIEQHVHGEVVRDRNEPRHWDNEGVCDHCGKKWPCSQGKKRELEKQRRLEMPAPKPLA